MRDASDPEYSAFVDGLGDGTHAAPQLDAVSGDGLGGVARVPAGTGDAGAGGEPDALGVLWQLAYLPRYTYNERSALNAVDRDGPAQCDPRVGDATYMPRTLAARSPTTAEREKRKERREEREKIRRARSARRHHRVFT